MTEDELDGEPTKDADKIVESERAGTPDQALALSEMLRQMGEIYRRDPMAVVRSQTFIQNLHRYVGSQLETRLTKFAVKRNITVRYGKPEAQILGSSKPKDVDVAAIDPQSGPLIIIGVRSQMSSVSKNVLTYYEGIIGECTSLQERFPLSTHGYIYLHPLTSIKEGKENESIDHSRYARMYAAITGRTGPNYKNLRGIFDQFAYMVVDFERTPPKLRDDIVQAAVNDLDLSINSFIDRIVATFNSRMLFWDVFK